VRKDDVPIHGYHILRLMKQIKAIWNGECPEDGKVDRNLIVVSKEKPGKNQERR